MPQTIARIYRSYQEATAAVNELHEHSFKAEAIRTDADAETSETMPRADGTATDPVLESIIKAGVDREHARIYAQAVHRGEVLVVVVDPPFGFAQVATNILESHDPIEVDLPAVDPVSGTAMGWNSATPLSSWLGWRVLWNDPTPLSNFLKRPVLKPEPESSRTLDRIRAQSGDAAPLSGKIGLKVLSDDPAPLSRTFGWGLLKEQAAPLSNKFGWKVLSDNPTPLSTWLGWRVLSDNPAPLSSLIGWRTRSER